MQLPYYKKNLLILGICIFFTAISYQLIMPFIPRFLEEMDVDPEQISFWTGLIFSVQAVSNMIANPIWGKIGDTYGRKPMVLRAGFVISVMYMAMFLCQTPFQLLIVRFINGFFTGFIPASITLISTNTPNNKVLTYVAAAQTLSAAGQIAGPSIGGLLGAIGGIRSVVIYGSAAVFLSSLAVLLFVKEINKPKPEEMVRTSIFADIKESVKSPVILRLIILSFFQGFFISGIMPFVIIHLGNKSSLLTGLIYSVPALSMILTAQIWSRLGKKYSYYLMMTIGFVGAGISIILFARIFDFISFAVIFFFFGLFSSAITTNTTAKTVSDIHSDFRGRALSIQASFMMLGNVVAPVTIGLISKEYDTVVSFTIVGIITLICGVLFFYSSKNQIKNEIYKTPSNLTDIKK